MDKDRWNRLVLEHGGDFLQSWEWGEFQRGLGRRIERIWTDDFAAQVVFRPLGFGRTAGYVPRGPLVVRDSIKESAFWGEFEKTKDRRAIFFEFDLLEPLAFLRPASPKTRQPRLTSILDLKKDEDEVFNRIHKNHRYSVRKAQERGICVKPEEDWRGFWRLLAKTARRQGFRIWSPEYYRKLYTTLAPAGRLEILGAYRGRQLTASHLYILFGDRATHLFGGSGQGAESASSVPLLHWEAMRRFRERGFTEYDFWGIEPKLPAGLVRFKERFGGERVEYPGSYVKVLRPTWYKLYRFGRSALL